MQIDLENMDEYLYKAALKQIGRKYEKLGFQVATEEMIGPFRADLVVRKADETIVFEIKRRRESAADRPIAEIADFAQKNGYKFHVVFPSIPKDKKIEVDGIESALFRYFSENTPPELMELSSRTVLNDVVDVEIDEIVVNEENIYIQGNAAFDITLVYEKPHEDDEDSARDYVPFQFSAALKRIENDRLEIETVESLNVDLSDYLPDPILH